tara:strand:+ start:493 stop:606 length:114 start_codon:yes stop_codon:yes gene_type:complete
MCSIAAKDVEETKIKKKFDIFCGKCSLSEIIEGSNFF